ncbi:aminopeptidase N [Aurantimonas endophytica]|uniref:Aminopeptidase N n=1 Tax=Aurantimonas endophytica TaxID=1522175 RepID=A0A7W6MQR6_9HYPH|nr:aminopeptidase N [Aurantimonas endophytica]MBB4004233.1 aminopeptidase N [Aurantimonas endophytica]MCO6405074.1 aminopeptidase N [Aurantimonas endophytica]
MLRTDDGPTIKLEDYRPTDFVLHSVAMTIRLFEGRAEVDTQLVLERREGVGADAPLVLDGDELTLSGLKLDGVALAPEAFTATPERLEIPALPAAGRFTLAIGTRIVPEENTKLMGLFRSNGVWCTQCEAEGFRRITYFLDRPDVLAPYRVRIEADQAAAPILLSNGNPGERGDLPDGRHFAVWDDPFNKPSYLFAVVAGDLDSIHEEFTTASGKPVTLGIYTEKGRVGQASYAMDALKRSMWWDERRFGREYDLDVFNIVAIPDFNMGAMENKGLNVFNHKYVLLDPDTATDADYAGVETVIAHEYFHNWTGNRITCRDWFQLCLKEGLTVYRDQEFSADERSAPVQRINSVRRLKAHQFPEDQGPLQHPVRPREYREINNFYTATVYDKGAELVRMIATILGRDDFRKGMDLYFERHDGDAATIEDFIACFEDAAGADLSQFALWYSQAGTPSLAISEDYDASSGTLTVGLKQALEVGASGTGGAPFHIPVRFGLVGSNGEDKAFTVAHGAEVEGDVIHLTADEETVVFENVGERPYLSVLRDFSAPVTLHHEQRLADRLALARLDPNLFNRWRILNDLVAEALVEASRKKLAPTQRPLEPEIVEAILGSAGDETIEAAYRAQALTLPSEPEIARMLAENVDPDAIHAAVEAARRLIGERGRPLFERIRAGASPAGEFSPDADSAGRRSLANVALGYLAAASGDPAPAEAQYAAARNMTDRLAALAILVHRFPAADASRAALADFYTRFEDDGLVVDKWFALQATIPDPAALDIVARLLDHPKFTLRNPNRVRALVGTFAGGNQLAFHRADGAGYRFVADRIAELDKLNPQVAARIATTFRSWRSFEAQRRHAAQETLEKLAAISDLSNDTRDIVERSLR